MKIRAAGAIRYDLPLRRAWATAHGRTDIRSGFILWLRARDGAVAYGDAADGPNAAGQGLVAMRRDIDRLLGIANEGGLEAGPEPPTREPVHRSVRHAWMQAELTLEAAAAGLPLADHLAHRMEHPRKPRARVAVNATLPLGPEEESVAAARAAVAEHYSCLKLKVGANTREMHRVAAVRDAVGDKVALRLDANGSWDEVETVQYLDALAPLNIEYVEQPLPPGRVSSLARIRRESPIPLAVDESAHNLAQALGLLKKDAVDVVVIKPMALGGLDRALQLLEATRRHGKVAVVTDSVESAIGRAGAVHLAALLGTKAPACGLASGEWLERDVVPRPPHVRRGFLDVPSGPGLGLGDLMREAVPR